MTSGFFVFSEIAREQLGRQSLVFLESPDDTSLPTLSARCVGSCTSHFAQEQENGSVRSFKLA